VIAGRALAQRLLYEHDGVVVVDKPPGVPSTGRDTTDPDSVQYALIRHFGAMTWAVHQLDADTSGVNVFVREKRLVPRWQNRMRFPNGHKTYLAVVHGTVRSDAQLIDLPIGVLATQPSKQLGVTAAGRPARSRVRVLDRGDSCSLLRVQIETGRTHQIRIHLAALGHPLLGEEWYRTPPCTQHERQALHAWSLHFDDGKAPQMLRSPLPDDLLRLLDARRLSLGTCESR